MKKWILCAAGVSLLSACAPPGNGVSADSSAPPTAAQIPPTSSPPAQTPPPTIITPPVVNAPAPRASSAANLRVCGGKSQEPGLDVSDYDPGTSWSAVRAGGAQFTFIKATEGITSKNALFPGDWVAAKAAGVARGAYHFFHPKDDPALQAQAFIKTMGTLDAGDLPAVLDWEVTDGESSAVQIANAKTWLTLVEAATGKVPIIYVDPSFWNALGNPVAFARYPLYIANYGASCPTVPPPWSDWTFWQNKIGAITGVKTTQADIDTFNGSVDQLNLVGSR